MNETGELRRRCVRGASSSLVLSSLVFFAACGDGETKPAGSAGSAGSAGDGASGSGGAQGEGGTNSTGGTAGNLAGEAGAGGSPEVAPVVVLPEQLPAARVGEAYEVELTVQGAQGAIAWQSLGSLPPGLTLTDTGDAALLSGTPTTAGQFSVGFSIEDALDLGVRSFPLRVLARPWLVYTTDESLEAVDIGSVSSGDLPEPYVLSRPLVGEEVVWLGAEQPGGVQFVFGYDEPLKGQGWVVSFAGVTPGGAVRVSPPQGTKENAREFLWSPDGSRLGFIAETEASAREGFVVDMSGPVPGVAHRATGAVPAGGSVQSQAWGGKNLAFLMSDPSGGPEGTPGARVSITDTAKLPPPAPATFSDWNAEQAWITRDGKRMAYWERTGASAGRMMTRKTEGALPGAAPPGAEVMHPPLGVNESGDTQCTWYDKGAGALVATREIQSANKRLYRTSFDAEGKPVVKPVTDGKHYVSLPLLSPAQTHVVYSQGDDATDPESRLWVVDISADEPSAPAEINGPVVAGGAIPDENGAVTFRWAPNSRHAAYTASALQADRRDAFLVDIAQPGKATRLNKDLPGASSKVADVVFSPDGSWIALLGDLEIAGVTELFLVSLLDGVPGEPQKANDALGEGEFVKATLVWSPDGRYLAFVIEDTGGTTHARLVELKDGEVGVPIPIGDADEHVSTLRFSSAGF